MLSAHFLCVNKCVYGVCFTTNSLTYLLGLILDSLCLSAARRLVMLGS